jgi:ribose 5-phosphate isomerase B
MQAGTLTPRTVAFGAVAPSPVADAVRELLEERGLTVIDVSRYDQAQPTWPSVGHDVAEAVAGRQAETGIALCWTGSGVAISASLASGSRPAFCSSADEARDAREWHDANILALSLRAPIETVLDTVRTWLNAAPSQNPGHIKARGDLVQIAGIAA